MCFIGERDALADVPNAIGYQRVLETATNGYLVRQYFYSSLYDRMRWVDYFPSSKGLLIWLALALFWKTLRKNGWHINCYALYEILMPAMFTMETSRQKTSWLLHGTGFIWQITLLHSRKRIYQRTIPQISLTFSTLQVDEHATLLQSDSLSQRAKVKTKI